MIKFDFDPHKPYAAVKYLRMSSDKQNPRSPDQQSDEIDRRMRACGYHWSIVREYRDSGISGRRQRDRKDFQHMLRGIRSGQIQIDLILVDTIERLGRIEEMPQLRKELRERHGVLVLTADSNFADPTSPQGKAMGMFEAMRATEDTRIKAHNVLRGKRDAATQRHWPGGPPPFGYRLESVFCERHGRQEVSHSVLVPDPETAWIMHMIFQKAAATSWGPNRLAKDLSSLADIPEKYKPFHPDAIAHQLNNPIYYGTLRFAVHCTDIVNDRRVLQRNQDDEVVWVADFCEPIVPRELWDQVQAMAQVRRDRKRPASQAANPSSEKQIKPLAPGLSLKYLLSGLVCCAECNQRMTASSSRYTAKDGSARHYVHYVCPRHIKGLCPNATTIPEEWLRNEVIDALTRRLFPSSAK